MIWNLNSSLVPSSNKICPVQVKALDLKDHLLSCISYQKQDEKAALFFSLSLVSFSNFKVAHPCQVILTKTANSSEDALRCLEIINAATAWGARTLRGLLTPLVFFARVPHCATLPPATPTVLGKYQLERLRDFQRFEKQYTTILQLNSRRRRNHPKFSCYYWNSPVIAQCSQVLKKKLSELVYSCCKVTRVLQVSGVGMILF